MRKAWAFSFATLGVSSLVAQVLLVRELLVVFTGNEFFIGWTLCAWLFWTAAGALWGGRLRAAVGPWLAAALLPATLAWIRAGRLWLGGGLGAVPDLLPSMAFSFCALAPLCGVLGAQFAAGLRARRNAGGDPGGVAGRAYALETAGFVAGGLAFSFALAAANEFRVAGLLGLLNLAAAAALGARRFAVAAWAALLVAVVCLAGRIDRATAAWRFPGQELVESRDSIYGNLAVTRIGGQLNFYENGLLLGAEDDRLAAEPLVHYPMLAHPDPKQVLLIGGGFTGALGEILKHGPARVDYVERDATLVELAKKYLAPARRAALEDPRVNVVIADARHFVGAPANAPPAPLYDVVLVNLPNPGTALINRYYSREFFRAVRRRLAPGGVLAVRLAFSPDYVGNELGNLGASIYRTLQAEFAAVVLLPDYEILYLATAEPAPAPVAAEWIARYEARGLATDFVVPPAIEERLETDRIGQVRGIFEAKTDVEINRDERPIACQYDFAYWLRSFHPRAAALADRLGGLRWPWGAVAAALVAAGMLGASRGRGGARRLGAWAMGVGSFSLMACELVLLLAFQIFRGYLYYRLALILAALMLGMAIGAALGARRRARPGPRTLAGIHALTGVYALGAALFMRFLQLAESGPWIEGAFWALAAAIGALAGFEFPAANRIYLSGAEADVRRAGVVYGVDLAGSCLGALVVGLWALPVLGTGATLAVLAGLNFAVAAICEGQRDS